MKTAVGLAAALLGLLGTSALATPVPLSDAQMSGVVAGRDFTVIAVTNEISDQPSVGAPTTDPLLQNSWGLSEAPAGGPLWVSDNNTGFATLYQFNNFAKIPLNVTIPGVGGQMGAPTGTVFTNGVANTFDVTQMINGSPQTDHALFLFDSEDGTVSAWGAGSSGASTVFPTTAVTVITQPGASFKGLAINNANTSNPVIYAADFTQNKVEMFNSSFQQIGAFTDHDLPPGFAPFNVQQLNGLIYVAYALRQPGTINEIDALGAGFVDVFTPSGQKIRTLVASGFLDAPWGLAIAPASFGKFAGDLLVGNFGNGFINAYDPNTGRFKGVLLQPNGKPVNIDGLWALFPGPNGSLIFSSGPGNETHGLVGTLTASTVKASWAHLSTVIMGH
jgi:uncharacterized protein (TIGR03118 family)